MLDNSTIWIEIFSCGADMRRRREKFWSAAPHPCLRTDSYNPLHDRSRSSRERGQVSPKGEDIQSKIFKLLHEHEFDLLNFWPLRKWVIIVLKLKNPTKVRCDGDGAQLGRVGRNRKCHRLCANQRTTIDSRPHQ